MSLLYLINNKNPDILLLNKTILNDKHMSFILKIIIVFENDRVSVTRGKEMAILIKKNIKFQTTINLPERAAVLETLIIKIFLKENKILYNSIHNYKKS